MVKVQQKKTPTKRSLKSQIIRGVIISLCIALSILLIYITPLVIIALQGSYMSANNPAKKVAQIMPTFAKTTNLQQISENNNAGGVDTVTNSYSYTFQGEQNMEQLANLTASYLKSSGYNVDTYFINKECIEGQYTNCLSAGKIPYWLIRGAGPGIDSIEGSVITNEATGKAELYINFSILKGRSY